MHAYIVIKAQLLFNLFKLVYVPQHQMRVIVYTHLAQYYCSIGYV